MMVDGRLAVMLAVALLASGCQRESADGPTSGQEPLEAPAHASPDVIKAGDTVQVVIEHAPVKVGKQIVATAVRGDILVAEKTQGRWVKVAAMRDSRPVKGWILREALALSSETATGSGRGTLRAQRLQIVDEQHRVRAEIGVFGAGGQPLARFYDQKGRGRIVIGLGDERSPVVALADEEGRLRASLQMRSAGEPVLALFDRQEKPRIEVFVSSGGDPGFRLLGADGRLRAKLLSDAKGTQLSLADHNGEPRASLGTVGSAASLILWGATGKPGVSAMAFAGKGEVSLYGANGKLDWRAP